MAYEKELKARIVHKHDISDHWDLAENFVPKQGELIIYDDRTLKQSGDTLVTDQIVDTRVRYKIGDGVTTVSLLPFADKELVDAIDTLYGDDTNTLSIREIATAVLGDAEKNQNAFSKVAVANQTTVEADSTTDTLTLVAGNNVTITTDATNDKVTIAAKDTTYSSKTAASGGTDVSLVTTGEKYTWNNKAASNHTHNYAGSNTAGGPANSLNVPRVLKSILEIAYEQAVNTETLYFNGGDAISTVDLPATYCISAIKKGDNHRTLIDTYCLNDGKHYINYNKSAHPNAANRQSWSGWQLQANNAFSTIAVGSTNIAADKADDTLTFVAGSNITLTPDANNDKITISANIPNLSAVENELLPGNFRPVSGESTELSFGSEFAFVDSINASNHEIQANISAYKLPNETTLSKGTTTGSGNAVTDITVSGHTITLKKEKTFLEAHPTITTQTDSTSTASPKHGESFTAIDSVSRDSNGHVIKVNTKTITLPTETVNKNLTVGSKTYNGSTAVEITAADLGLEQAMKFIGSSSTNLTDGATTNPITINSKSVTAVAGNVVLSNGAEFVWTGSAWEKLGQDGSFSLKTHSHTASYTPAGTVGTPTITVNASDTTVNSITNVGTLPSASLTNGGAVLTGTVSDGPNRTVTLNVSYTAPVLTFDAGSLPTKGSNVTVLTGITSATSSQPTFTGTAATITTNAANS